MSDEAKPKKHRRRRGYTILIVSEDPAADTNTCKIGPFAAQFCAFAGFALLVFLICFSIYALLTISGLRQIGNLQLEQIKTLTEEKNALVSENSNLNAVVARLSKSINQKTVKETYAEREDAEKHLPTGMPLTGAAIMIVTRDLRDAVTIDESIERLNELTADGVGEEDLPGHPFLHFTEAAAGSSVVASGAGTVERVDTDEKYGQQVVIDHGNGYQSVYRNAGDAMVRAGDEVTRGSILFIIDSNNIVGYQLMQDGSYIDPLSMTQIDG